jgi:hypothetical protein
MHANHHHIVHPHFHHNHPERSNAFPSSGSGSTASPTAFHSDMHEQCHCTSLNSIINFQQCHCTSVSNIINFKGPIECQAQGDCNQCMMIKRRCRASHWAEHRDPPSIRPLTHPPTHPPMPSIQIDSPNLALSTLQPPVVKLERPVKSRPSRGGPVPPTWRGDSECLGPRASG